MLAPEHNAPGEAEASADFGVGGLQISLVHNRSWHQLIYLEYVGVAIQPLQLLLEQNTAARLVRLYSSVLEQLQPLIDQAATSTAAAAAAAAAPTAAPAAAPTAAPTPPTPAAIASGGNWGADGGGEDAEVAGAHLVQEVFLRELHLHPVSVSCTVQLSAPCDEAEMQEPAHRLLMHSTHCVAVGCDREAGGREAGRQIGRRVQGLQMDTALEDPPVPACLPAGAPPRELDGGGGAPAHVAPELSAATQLVVSGPWPSVTTPHTLGPPGTAAPFRARLLTPERRLGRPEASGGAVRPLPLRALPRRGLPASDQQAPQLAPPRG